MKPKKNRFLAIAAASVVFPSPAFAADGTWNTTTSGALWTLDTNWLGSTIADGSGFTADFSKLDITADTTVALNGNRTIGNLTFGDTATATAGHWTLNGAANALTLAGGTPTITVNALGTGKYVALNAGLSGTSGFTKNGSGMLILGSSGNTLSGAVTLSAGTLQLNSAALTNATTVAINSGTLVVATTAANALGGTISFGGGFLQFNSAPLTDYSAQFSTSANQAYKIVTGVATTLGSNLASLSGSLNVQGSGNLTLSAANTFNGTTTNVMNTGNLILSNALALQNSAIDATNSVTATATRGFILSGVTTPTFGGLTGTKELASLFNSTTGGYGSVTSLTLNPATGASNSYSGVIANGAAGMSLTKSGAGSQTLSATNTYTGATTVNAGTLTLGHATNTLADTGSVAVSGGTLALGTNSDTVGAVTVSSGTITSSTGVLTGSSYDLQSGTVGAILGGTGIVATKSTSGTLTLSGNNTYTGGTAINGGVLSIGNAAALGSSGTISFGGGTLQYNGVATDLSSRFSTAASQAYNIDTNGQSVTLASSLTSSGGTLAKSGTGTLTLSGNNTYTGGTAINAGTLVLGAANAIGTSGTVSFGGGTLRAFNTTDYSSRFSTAASQAYNLDTNGQNVTWASGLTSSGGTLTKSGTGTLTLSGGTSNTFSGAITVSAGRLSSLNSASLQNLTGTITVASGATFDAKANFGGNITKNFILSGTGSGLDGHGALNIRENANLTGAITLNAATLITHDWNIATVSGSITGTDTNLELKTLQASQYGFVMSAPISLGTGALTLTGIGTVATVDFALSGTNSFTGGTLLKGGRVSFSKASALGSGTVTFVLNTSLAATAGLTHANGLTVNSGIAATLEAAASTTWVQAGAVTGNGSLTKSGSGELRLTGGVANTFTGTIAVNVGRFSVVDGASLKNSTGGITVASGAAFNFGQNFTANNLTNALTLSGTGDGTYGALNLGANAVATGGITLAADTTITHDYNNGTIQTGAITGSGRNLQLTTTQAAQEGIAISSAIQTGAGRVSVTGVANAGAYSVQLGGNNTFTGGLTINNGIVQLNSAGALNSTAGSENAVTFGASTTTGKLALNGRSYVISNLTSNATPGSPVVENGNATAGTLTVGNSQNLSGTYAGVIQNGSGGGLLSLTKAGTGTLTLSGANTYTGATLISGGTLKLDASGTINNTSDVSLGTAGTFDVSAKSLGYTVGTLKGSGNVIGALAVSTQLAIGNSPGTTQFSSNLTLGAASTFAYELTSGVIPGLNSADLGDIAGALTITAGSILDLFQLGTYTAGNKFTLFAYDGLLTGTFTDTSSNILSDGATFSDAGGIWTIDYNDTTAGANGGASASNTFVTITAVPEPNVAALVGGLGLLALLRRRR